LVKKILNLQEEATNLRLKEVCYMYDAHAYPKIRVADVLPIEGSGISNEQFRFALQAHFDFVVCDKEQIPQFAVEFDGPSHKDDSQRRRDLAKDDLCDRFEFPILRINLRHIVKKYKSYDLLSWFVEHWFLAQEFYEAQRQGHVPWDEPYDPMMFFTLPGRSHRFPMWLSSGLRIKVQHLQKKGKIKDSIISHWIGVDKSGHYHGLSWLRINDAESILAESGMRKQRFPVSESELLSEILAFLVFERLEAVFSGEESALPIHEIHRALHAAAAKYKMRSFAGCSNDKPTSAPAF
jgi:hypothetical protein